MTPRNAIEPKLVADVDIQTQTDRYTVTRRECWGDGSITVVSCGHGRIEFASLDDARRVAESILAML